MAPKLEKAINADGRDRSTLAQLSGMALKRFERVVADPGKASVPEVIDIMKALDLKYEDVFPTEAEMSA
ncbi:hypothetical protein [Demequina sediminis]|nr:hypothetical protein [Demequina sediminis]